FKNDACLTCGRALGFIPSEGVLVALEPLDDGRFEAVGLPGRAFRKCHNYEAERACNWVLEAEEAERYCASCRLSQTIPDLSDPAQRARWSAVEAAKRYLVHNLRSFGLTLVSKQVDPERGVAFDIMATTPDEHVMTGHAGGLITLNVEEAGPVARERAR